MDKINFRVQRNNNLNEIFVVGTITKYVVLIRAKNYLTFNSRTARGKRKILLPGF